ncbi:hypothetical protein [Maridesulfovibrio sp.]|uniref:hypothetical protein n=1 Tax=Maridesulfovibrio sp. TaxID=2795000 RepID=UPI002A18C52C|nr:hypothetical protein [Maridesulfovibrio sp.]
MGFDIRIGTTIAEQLDNSAFKLPQIKPDVSDEDSDRKNIDGKIGDTVSISAEGLEKSNELIEKSSKEVLQDVSKEDQMLKMIQEKIKEIEKELKELKQNPEQNKEAIKMKEQELQQYQGMLLEIMNKKKGAGGTQLGAGGGTPTQGSASSLTEVPEGMLCEVRF